MSEYTVATCCKCQKDALISFLGQKKAYPFCEDHLPGIVDFMKPMVQQGTMVEEMKAKLAAAEKISDEMLEANKNFIRVNGELERRNINLVHQNIELQKGYDEAHEIMSKGTATNLKLRGENAQLQNDLQCARQKIAELTATNDQITLDLKAKSFVLEQTIKANTDLEGRLIRFQCDSEKARRRKR